MSRDRQKGIHKVDGLPLRITPNREPNRRVAWCNDEGGYWGIWVWNTGYKTEHGDPQIGIGWWPLSWLKFATKSLAQEYLEVSEREGKRL